MAIKIIRRADSSQSLSVPLVVFFTYHFSLFTYHSSHITSLQHAYAACRSQRCQHRCQNRYNHLYHRLPCFLLHNFSLIIYHLSLITSHSSLQRVAPVGALFATLPPARFPCHHLPAADCRHCRCSRHPAMDCSTRCPQSHRCR